VVGVGVGVAVGNGVGVAVGNGVGVAVGNGVGVGVGVTVFQLMSMKSWAKSVLFCFNPTLARAVLDPLSSKRWAKSVVAGPNLNPTLARGAVPLGANKESRSVVFCLYPLGIHPINIKTPPIVDGVRHYYN